MSTGANFAISPAGLVQSIWRSRELVFQLVRRMVVSRYRGSFLGLGWSFLYPLLMLSVYIFVFSVVFNARVNTFHATRTEFALLLFLGLTVYTFFTETLNSSSEIILNNVNYVKKVVFPLELLPLAVTLSAFFRCWVSVGVFIIGLFLVSGAHVEILFLPLVLCPLFIFALGFSWFLSAFSVYFRDMRQLIVVANSLLLFLAPVFYPLASVPRLYQSVLLLNPITFVIVEVRSVSVRGQQPDWNGLFYYFAAALIVSWLGYCFFQKTRKGFSDEL